MSPIDELNEIAGYGKDDPTDMPTIFDQIHRRSINDAVKVGRIASNLSALAHGAYDLMYDQIIIHLMIAEGWTDQSGTKREIQLHAGMAEPAMVSDGVLYINRDLYESRDLRMDNIKDIIGRYLCGFHLRVDKKLAEKLRRAVHERKVSEFTAFGNYLNETLYERSVSDIEFIIDSTIELAFDAVTKIQPGYASGNDYPAIREFAMNVGMAEYDNPSDYPFVTLFNAVVTSGLFMDDRAYGLYQLHRSIVPSQPEDATLAEAARMNFIVSALAVVKF